MDRDDTRDRTADRVETVKKDTRDAIDEMGERVKAGAERVKRSVEGDDMPLGERIGSHVNEMKHNVKADFDKSKREVRDETTKEEGI